MEPWDRYASISFTDGKIIGATLDRNGLRPSRFCVTSDDMVVMASESGALPVDPAKIIKSGRLQPGKMFLVDLAKGKIVSDEELKKKYVLLSLTKNGWIVRRYVWKSCQHREFVLLCYRQMIFLNISRHLVIHVKMWIRLLNLWHLPEKSLLVLWDSMLLWLYLAKTTAPKLIF